MLSKKILVPTLAVVVGGTAFLGVRSVHAQSNNGIQSLVQEIAQKFNLDQSQVQSVFDNHHSKRQDMMKQKMEDRLTQAVKDGKLTEAQKQAILTKIQEVKNNLMSADFKNKTPQEKKQAMEWQRQDLENWAKSQGIDSSYLMKRSIWFHHPFAK